MHRCIKNGPGAHLYDLVIHVLVNVYNGCLVAAPRKAHMRETELGVLRHQSQQTLSLLQAPAGSLNVARHRCSLW